MMDSQSVVSPSEVSSAAAAGGKSWTLQVPQSLQVQLAGYRRRLWGIKLGEGFGVTLATFACGWLVVFAVDRVLDAPPWFRALILAGILAASSIIPLFIYRWIVQRRTLPQLARLLRRKLPSVGDSLLGVIELAANESEQARSPALCQAAMDQVAEDAQRRDLLAALPPSKYRFWGAVVIVLAVVLVGMLGTIPAATTNALQRLIDPWGGPPRYTFTRIDSLPSPWRVPHGEPVAMTVALEPSTAWQPEQASLQIGHQAPLASERQGDRYEFLVPPQIDPQDAVLRVGDVIQRVPLEPTLRPEVVRVTADIELPAYLQHRGQVRQDGRGGSFTVVKGSQARIEIETSRELQEASLDGAPLPVQGNRFSTPTQGIEQPLRQLTLQWRDALELAGKQPLRLEIVGVDDQAPSLICEGLPRQEVILVSELLKFTLRASDDFGIRQTGIMWRGIPGGLVASPTSGERVLASGSPEQQAMEVLGTFSATSLGIEPQAIELFVWAEDYLPDRPRTYSAPYTLYVLDPQQHAIWMTEQLSKWHRQALEVRDAELQLHEANKEIRRLLADGQSHPEMQEQISRQAQAEENNARRLQRLTELGDQLLQRASRNEQMGVGHVENWAQMLQILKEISATRMPRVAALLRDAAEAPTASPKPGKPPGPAAGQIRDLRTAASGEAASEPPPSPTNPPSPPAIVDHESSLNPLEKSEKDSAAEEQNAEEKKPAGGSLGLPGTTIAGKEKKSPAQEDENQEESPAEEIDEAVAAQAELLAEFEKIANELNEVLANLEGSTLVKRLKAASRRQTFVGERIAGELQSTFGRRVARLETAAVEVLQQMSGEEEQAVKEVSFIMDDLAAYFERRRSARFQSVLEEMRSAEVIDALRQLTGEIGSQQGLSLSQCEFWADTLDRWADDLVDPARSGQCPGGKSRSSLPPSIVLEVLRILEAEVNLREETRVAQQARQAVELAVHMEESLRLSQQQANLREHVFDVGQRILQLPEAEEHFAQEVELLAAVDQVMGQAAGLLAQHETGVPAIATETEAIELLLQSRRINPKGGGGGAGSAPGGGGSGTTTDAALALLGTGVNAKEVREDRGTQQATGTAGIVLPEEFRAGLDEYFNQLERVGGQ